MSDDNSNSPWQILRSNAQPVIALEFEGMIASMSPPSISPQRASTLLDDDFNEQYDSATIYSYYSTWSSNYTMTNLPGPGRLLGKLLSSAGSTLERRLGKLAYRAGIGSLAKAEANLNLLRSMLESKDMTQKEKACTTLLGYARHVTSLLHS